MRFPIILALLLIGAPAAAQPKGPPYYDPKRSLKKQDEAAREATDKARSGGADDVAKLLNDVSVYVRDAVVKVVTERNDEALFKKLERHLSNKRAPVGAAGIAEVFGRCKYTAGRKALEKYGLKSPSELVALESIWALEAIGDKAAGKALAAAHKKKHRASPYRVQGDALIALAVVDPSRARPLIEKALKHKKKAPLRIAALEALARIDRARAAKAAVALIPLKKKLPKAQKSWGARLLFAALDTLGTWTKRSGHKAIVTGAIDACIARLEKADGLSKYRLARALQDLTGANLGMVAEDWRNWWSTRKDSFEPQDKVVEKENKKKKRKRRRGRKGKKKGDEEQKDEGKKKRPITGRGIGKTKVRFHGISIYSNRLMFAQDVSGGMKNPLDKDADDSPTKMKIANDELKRVLKQLGDEVHTNICFFATKCEFTSPRLFPIKKVRKKLISFVATKAVVPKGYGMGRSNLYDTLVKSMLDPELDTIFFLSEGGPTEGLFRDKERFMRHLGRLNVYQRVRVHTLQITKGRRGEAFLRELAKTTGGSFFDLEYIKKAHGL